MTKVYCDSEATREGENFGCLEEAGHLGEHQGQAYHGPPCPMCGRLDGHDAECMLWYLMEDRSLPLQVVVWEKDDGEASLRPYQREADRCPHCAGTGRASHSAGGAGDE